MPDTNLGEHGLQVAVSCSHAFCTRQSLIVLQWESTLVALDTMLAFAVTGTRIASMEAKAAAAKGSAVRLMASAARRTSRKSSPSMHVDDLNTNPRLRP